MARATRGDVAKAAGVSVSTVSHVMNGRAEELGFSRETAERVREAARAVGYVPSAAARSFRYQSSKIIALFLPDPRDSLRLPVFSELLTGCIDAARERGRFILPVPIGAGALESVERTLREVELAGAVCRASSAVEPAAELLERAEIPVAWISTGGALPPGPGCAALGIDESPGVVEMVNSIDTRSVRHPVVILGPGEPSQRVSTFIELFPGAEVMIADGWFARDAHSVARTALERGADLIFAGNDYLAIGVLRILAERGSDAGSDVQVFGFGDVQAGPAEPIGLSSVHWPLAELGAGAIGAIVDGGMRDPVMLRTHACPRRTTRPRIGEPTR